MLIICSSLFCCLLDSGFRPAMTFVCMRALCVEVIILENRKQLLRSGLCFDSEVASLTVCTEDLATSEDKSSTYIFHEKQVNKP